MNTNAINYALELLNSATDEDLLRILVAMKLTSLVCKSTNSKLFDHFTIATDELAAVLATECSCGCSMCDLRDPDSINKGILSIAKIRNDTENSSDPAALNTILRKLHDELSHALYHAVVLNRERLNDYSADVLLEVAKRVALKIDSDEIASNDKKTARMFLALVY